VLQPGDFPLLQSARPAAPASAPYPAAGNAGPAHLKPWETEERQTIAEALARYKGNRKSAAAHLGMSRTTLWRKIKTYNV